VAISDPLMITAQGIEIIRRKDENKQRRTLARIEELIREYGVTRIVLGMPYNMNDTLGERAEKTLAFKEKLERRSGLPVTLWDERLTTFEAESIMTEAGVTRAKQKEYVDMIAAILILQGYINGKNLIQDRQ
jgi:putative Holliday junction resolvase